MNQTYSLFNISKNLTTLSRFDSLPNFSDQTHHVSSLELSLYSSPFSCHCRLRRSLSFSTLS
ncbi:BnaC06g01200D [Brassica napus]|uniref:BnaC06g01200D protein n=1 Tax=Brassica napus TaxID=3708 RepID=A0A078G309_BRANA|nr:BnaC06g01200D [Brassica napus]